MEASSMDAQELPGDSTPVIRVMLPTESGSISFPGASSSGAELLQRPLRNWIQVSRRRLCPVR